jgi:integrase
MSVRKREWTTAKGEAKSAWVADYVDQLGKRRLKTFDRKKDADAFAATASVEVREGTHTAASASVTVAEAAREWLTTADETGLERATRAQYKQHVDLHIVPLIGRHKLSQLTVPGIREFESRLRTDGRSETMVRKIVGSLSSILSDAQERGRVARNVVREMKGRRKPGKDRRAEARRKGKLKVGVDIPTREEVRAILGAVEGRWRPLLLTAVFTGLRASELRGLSWDNVNLDKAELHVRERADRYNDLGRPKSEAGDRTVPLTPQLVNTLKAWKLQTGGKGLVFGNGRGNVESLGNIINRGMVPPQLVAGVTVPVLGEGKPAVRAKYTGMHALRHFYASWCINPKSAGGLELSPKVVQERLGHSSIQMTLDVYGHLFPRGDDSAELAAAEAALLG